LAEWVSLDEAGPLPTFNKAKIPLANFLKAVIDAACSILGWLDGGIAAESAVRAKSEV